MRTFVRALALAAAAAAAGGCILGGGSVSAFEPDARRLGIVMPFVYKSPGPGLDDVPHVLADRLTRALFDTKRLRVIDPGRLDPTLKEMKLPTGSPLDAGTMAAVCGKLRAETAVFGTIPSAVKTVSQGSRVHESLTVKVEAHLVLCSTTEVLSSASAIGLASVSYRPGKAPPPELLVNEALENASRRLAFLLVKDLQPRP